MKKSLILCLLFIITLFSFGFCETIEEFKEGKVDWEKGIVTAEGWGFPKKGMHPGQARIMAEEAAKIVAYRNLIEIVNGIKVNSETTVKDSAVENDTIRTQVKGFVKGAKISEPKYFDDGTVKVVVNVPLSGIGGLSEIFFPKLSTEEGKEVTKNIYRSTIEIPEADFSKPYTGLVIDAREIKLHPAMNPKIVDEEGKEVYGVAFVGQEFAVKFGMVGYAKSIEQAALIDRVKDNPLIIKALNSSGKQKTDVVVSNVDAAMLSKLNNYLTFLKECKVVFVLD